MFSHERFLLERCHVKGAKGPVVMLLLCAHKSHPLLFERSETHFDVGYKRISGPVLIQHPVSSPSDLPYRVASPIRKRSPIGPYRRPRPRILAGSQGGRCFTLGDVPLYVPTVLPDEGSCCRLATGTDCNAGQGYFSLRFRVSIEWDSPADPGLLGSKEQFSLP